MIQVHILGKGCLIILQTYEIQDPVDYIRFIAVLDVFVAEMCAESNIVKHIQSGKDLRNLKCPRDSPVTDLMGL